ncbi:MAG: ABC transporter permease [Armatimonadota bacterium]
MAGYIARRLIQAVPVVLAVVILNFLIVHLAPGDPVNILVGEYGGTAEFRERVRHEYGLDQPVLTQLAVYLRRAFRGDLGYSLYFNQPVIHLILGRLPATMLLMASQLVFALAVGVSLGVAAARRPYSILDSASTAIALVGYSMPVFWSGLLFILLFSTTLGLLPSGGLHSSREQVAGLAVILDVGRHLILPAFTLGLVNLALYVRLTRASMLEVLSQDYVRTAWAKGLAERRVLRRHALRNALLPVVTITGIDLGRMIGGAVLTETVFTWPGVGTLTFTALQSRDYPVIVGTFMLVSIGVILANLFVDVMYGILDPRIQYA